ncbi:MAG: hypothetical protein QY326_04555 [Bdellovibrionota bacterium]|nr:MAG: hypothetical protein QY326_04555 [Bdellovibrionota bacterium]
MAHSISSIKAQILAALRHAEAEEGLYFRNFYQLHEEDEREPVQGTQVEILDALKDLIAEGLVSADDSGPELVFHLTQEHRTAL